MYKQDYALKIEILFNKFNLTVLIKTLSFIRSILVSLTISMDVKKYVK